MAQAQKVKGNGKVTTETRKVSDYHRIHASGSFTVHLVEGTEGHIQIKGESNILPLVVVEVKGNTLHLSTKHNRSIQYKKPLVITVPVQEIGAVVLQGSGEIITKTKLATDILEVQLSGSGDMEIDVEASRVLASVKGSGDVDLNGIATILSASVTGSGDLSAFGLDSENTEVTVTGSGDAEVLARSIFVGTVTGSGDILYGGNPEKETIRLQGSGSIQKR